MRRARSGIYKKYKNEIALHYSVDCGIRHTLLPTKSMFRLSRGYGTGVPVALRRAST